MYKVHISCYTTCIQGCDVHVISLSITTERPRRLSQIHVSCEVYEHFSVLTPICFGIPRWRLWPIPGPTDACGWALNSSLRLFILQARQQSSPPHPQSCNPMVPLMSSNHFWTLTRMIWIYTASGAIIATIISTRSEITVFRPCVKALVNRFDDWSWSFHCDWVHFYIDEGKHGVMSINYWLVHTFCACTKCNKSPQQLVAVVAFSSKKKKNANWLEKWRLWQSEESKVHVRLWPEIYW